MLTLDEIKAVMLPTLRAVFGASNVRVDAAGVVWLVFRGQELAPELGGSARFDEEDMTAEWPLLLREGAARGREVGPGRLAADGVMYVFGHLVEGAGDPALRFREVVERLLAAHTGRALALLVRAAATTGEERRLHDPHSSDYFTKMMRDNARRLIAGVVSPDCERPLCELADRLRELDAPAQVGLLCDLYRLHESQQWCDWEYAGRAEAELPALAQRLGVQALPWLARALPAADSGERLLLTRCLGVIDGSEARALLAILGRDQTPVVRDTARAMLGRAH